MTYFEMEDGMPAPRTMATSIRKTVRSIWIGLVTAEPRAALVAGLVRRAAEGDAPEKEGP